MKKRPSLWQFWFLWVLVTTASGFVGVSSGVLVYAVVAFLSYSSLGAPPSLEGILIGSGLGGLITGAILGISQALVLRKYFYRIRDWIVASMTYGAISLMLTVWQMNAAWSKGWINTGEIWSKSLLLGAVAGAIAGFLQWLVLRSQLPQASRQKTAIWLLISPLSMMCSFPLLLFGDGSFAFNLFSPFFKLELGHLMYLGGFMLYAAMTGFGLVWLLRQRREIL
jgi:hypothetical protein